MERIRLTRNEKVVLRLTAMGKGRPADYAVTKYNAAVRLLEGKALVKAVWAEESENPLLVRITENGTAYLTENPALHNPINWVAIGAIAGLLGFGMAIVALFVACNK